MDVVLLIFIFGSLYYEFYYVKKSVVGYKKILLFIKKNVKIGK